MHPLLRWGVFGIAVSGAFAAGYLLKNVPAGVTAAARPGTTAVVPPPPGAPKAASLGTVIARQTMTVAHTAPAQPGTMTVGVTEEAPRRVEVTPPRAEPPTILLPPVAVGEKPGPEPVDPNDPALRMIKDALNIKTTVLDRPAPLPVILADAKKDAEPIPPPPTPMTGPPPRLDMPEPRFAAGPPVINDPPASRPVPLLNNRAVELDFEVTRAGLSKVKAVELWTTRDGGTTWKQTDRMEGARPPFRTRLGSEGEYGFRLVFESESGMRTPEPKPGQPPELLMELDTTPPRVAIHAPRLLLPGQPGKVVLSWSADDVHLDRDPAATRLEYSADGQTWQAIERPANPAVANSLEWALPPGVPPKVLLRVTVRDKAGNVAVAVTNEKMSVDLVPPEGKVTGVRAQGQGPEPGPMPRETEAAGPVDGPIPAVLRSLLPALLNSPLLSSGVVIVHQMPEEGLLVTGYILILIEESPPFLVKDWVAGLTKTDVVEEPPTWTYRRRNPFAIPALSADLQPIADPPWTDSGVAVSLAGRSSIYHWPLVPGWGRMTEQQFQDFLAEFPTTATLGVLTDTGWRPSTAKPASHRVDGPAFADLPFGGVFDAVPGFRGTLPAGAVRLDF